ncbi:MAG: hypothetical protein FWH17_02545 [Oscillospiraceae bacterium]|nr:hypothetical protein [Oscillospiraceae bacterium]
MVAAADFEHYDSPDRYVQATYENSNQPADLDQVEIHSMHAIAIEAEGFPEWSQQRGQYAYVRRLQTANPHLNPFVREKVDGLCEYLRDHYKNSADMDDVGIQAYKDMLETDNMGNLGKSNNKWIVYAQRNSLVKKDKNRQLAEELINYLNGTGPDPTIPLYTNPRVTAKTAAKTAAKTPTKEDIKNLFGIDLDDPTLTLAMAQPTYPSNSNFNIESIPVVINKDAFMAKMNDGGNGLSQNEMNYAVATFDSNMIGLLGRQFGGGYSDHRPGTPGHLGKFDSIFIDGIPVSDLCKDKTAHLKNDTERNNYMKCFVTAQAMGRDKHIDFALPPNNTPEKLRLISLTAKMQDPPVKEPLWRRPFVLMGWIDPSRTPQQKYEKTMADDPHKDARTQLAAASLGAYLEQKEAAKAAAAQTAQPQAALQNVKTAEKRQAITQSELLAEIKEDENPNAKYVAGARVRSETLMKKGTNIKPVELVHGFSKEDVKARTKQNEPVADSMKNKIKNEIAAKK